MWKSFYRKRHETLSVDIESTIYAEQTDIQQVEILQSKSLGEVILMDGCPQISWFDSAAYHESLVHPACIIHGNVRDVFVVGGGEGVLLHELLKHSTVTNIVQCDIDEKANAAFDRYLETWHHGSFHDPRVTLYFQDARDLLESSSEKYDLIIVDVTAPVDDGPSHQLFTREFFEIMRSRLNNNGIVVSQAQSVSANDLECFSTLYNTASSVFPVVEPMHFPFLLVGDDWGALYSCVSGDPSSWSVEDVEKRISEIGLNLAFYSGRCHQSIFNLPKYVYDYLESHGSISTDEQPFMYSKLEQ